MISSPNAAAVEAIVGRESGRHIDVFRHYYERRREAQKPPHHEFANTHSNPEGIAGFTARWGPLIKDRLPNPFNIFSAQGKRWKPDPEVFWFSIDTWLEHQSYFRKMLELARSRRVSAKGELAEMFERWSGLELASFEPLKPRIQIQGGRLLPSMQVSGLWESLCLMLWEDLSVSGIRILRCADPNCANYFSTDRPRKKFCSRQHSLRFYKRLWARKNLRGWRAKRRS